MDSFATQEWIIATLKLLVTIIRLKEESIKSAILNTGAEANIISYELTKELRCLILSIEYLKLKTVLE